MTTSHFSSIPVAVEEVARHLPVAEAARSRMSIRAYSDEPVAPEDIRQIIETALLAPSALNVQPWRFVVVEDSAVMTRLKSAAYGQRQFSTAPAAVVLYTDMEEAMASIEEVVHPGFDEQGRARALATARGHFEPMGIDSRGDWSLFPAGTALGYLLLAAESLGYRTSTMAGFEPDKVREILGLPDHARIPAIVTIGRGAEEGFPHHRHSLERAVRFV